MTEHDSKSTTGEAGSTDGRTDAASAADEPLIAGLRAAATPLETIAPEATGEGSDGLAEFVGGADVVAIGEATHGGRECFEFRHRLVRQLVTECGLRLCCLEANFSEALAIDEYVVHGTGTRASAIEGCHFWTWDVEAFHEFVEWLREFNASRPLADRVRIRGIDAQFTQGPVDALVEYFERVDPTFLDEIRPQFETVADGGTSPAGDDSLDERLAVANDLVADLRARLTGRHDQCVTRTSKRAWRLARQHVRVLARAIEYKRAIADYQDGDESTSALERCMRVRDRAMADTVDWIRDYEDADRLVVLAHDAHVNRTVQSHRHSGATARSMGGHLAARHGDNYYALGCSFGRGRFRAIARNADPEDETTGLLQEHSLSSPLPGTIDATLATLGDSPLLVDVETAADDERIAEWLAEPRGHFSVGATYDAETPEEYVTEYVYSDAFDGIYFIDEMNPTIPIRGD